MTNNLTRGEAFRAKLATVYSLEDADAVWLAMLDETVRAMDLVERIEANVIDRPLTTPGSTGQDRADPLLGELRQQRAALSRLLVALGAHEGETLSQRQTRLARRRWSGAGS